MVALAPLHGEVTSHALAEKEGDGWEGGRGRGWRVLTLVPAPSMRPVPESESQSSDHFMIVKAVCRHRSKTMLFSLSPSFRPPILPPFHEPTHPSETTSAH